MKFTVDLENQADMLKSTMNSFVKKLSKKQKTQNAVNLLLRDSNTKLLKNLAQNQDIEHLEEIVRKGILTDLQTNDLLIESKKETREMLLKEVQEALTIELNRFLETLLSETSDRLATGFFKGQQQAILKALQKELA